VNEKCLNPFCLIFGIVVELGGNGFGKGRRGFLKFLAGLGLGAAGVEVYERLYSIPSLERRFREELNYWVGRYNSAYAELNNLATQLNAAERRIEDLAAQHNAAQRKIEDLTLQIRRLDELEAESTSAISFYQQQLEEAIKGLRNTVEKYRSILGEERVAFESATLKVLEDLKITIEDLRSTNEKLLRLLPHFPLIKDLSWRPTKVVNDKIYDVNVSLEVISPLNSLIEVEVQLIPVEYTHLPMEAFPVEQVKTVKLNPKGSEKELFNATFTDLKGGREYIIKATARDTADSIREEKIKTPYIREFENIAPLDNIIVMATYLLWYRADRSNWRDGYKHQPLLGEYVSNDPLVMLKHIDWATGHGIDGFFVSWSGYESGDLKYFDSNLKMLLNTSLAPQIKFAILYESVGRLVDSHPGWNLDDERNVKILKGDLSYLAENYFSNPSYLNVGDRPVVYFYEGKGVFANSLNSLQEKLSEIRAHIKTNYGFDIYWMNDHAHPLAEPSQKIFSTELLWGDVAKLFDGITTYGGYSREHAYPEEKYISYLRQGFEKWYKFAEDYKLGFVPFALVGYDPRYVAWGNKEAIPIERDPGKFFKRLELASYYLGNVRLLWVHEFNNFFEDTQIEPTLEEGFIFLKTLKKFLQNYKMKW